MGALRNQTIVNLRRSILNCKNLDNVKLRLKMQGLGWGNRGPGLQFACTTSGSLVESRTVMRLPTATGAPWSRTMLVE